MAPKAEKTTAEKYKKHELRTHIQEIPDTWIGSVEHVTMETSVYDDATRRMVKKDITYVPGLLKIFDEVIVNAIDQTVRLTVQGAADAKPVKNIWITANQETGRLTVTNDGMGIDVEKHPEHNLWVPELIFGELLTSSNYNQEEDKLWGGKNGMGVKLTNIFSLELTVETIDCIRKKSYSQRFFNNMRERDPAVVKANSKAPFTRISFLPDYARFGLKGMTDDMFALFRKRAFDACATTAASVSVYFNEERLEAKTFERYTDLYLGDKASWPRAYEASEDGRWEVVATYSEHGQFDQVSFVNGINTFRAGKHVDYITNQIAKNMVELMAKKKRTATQQHIKANLMVFVKALIVNPSFDSQSKETLNTPVAKFGSKFEISDKFMASLYKTGIADRASSLTAFHETKAAKKTDGKKTNRVIVSKLNDANLAGTRHSQECTLILTEGDSAASMAIAGLSVVGRDRYGVFPLKGKILNVKDAALTKISDNDEITNLKKILGLQQGKNYVDTSELRYGRVMLMCDSDVDGSHIKGLLFNMFQSLWPSLYKQLGFTVSLLTPIVTVTHKDGEVHDFYNMADFHKWLQANGSRKTWTIKYKKGLGTNTEAEAKQYFKNMHITTYKYTELSDEAMDLAFNKKRADNRKEWLMQYNPDINLDYSQKELPYDEFVHKELIHFSNRDLERSINHMCDGLKESTRKILFGCFKRRLFKNEVKVAQLAAYVSEHSAYHHGEASLQQAITGMAQVFVGTNNVNLLVPNGQFGSRIQGGSDAASPRYIYTLLSQLARAIYKEEDAPVLKYLDDDGTPVEPSYYIPIIPMVLVNGAMGIGTGFSTNLPQHNPTDIIAQCIVLICALDNAFKTSKEPGTHRQIDSDADLHTAFGVIDTVPLKDLVPFYLGFKGTIGTHKEGAFVSRGIYRWVDDVTVEITELPVGTWSQDYKEYLESLIVANNPILKDMENHCTAQSVRFILRLYPGVRAGIESNFETEFRLASTKNLSLNNIHLYNEKGAINKYKDTNQVLREWAHTRLTKYMERKNYQLKTMEHAHMIVSAKVRFIQDIIDTKIKIMNKKIKEVDAQLAEAKYPTIADEVAGAGAGAGDEESGTSSASTAPLLAAPSYSYLTKMPINQLTYEKKLALEKEAADINMKINVLRDTPIHHIWRKELNELSGVWEDHKAAIEEVYKADSEHKMPATSTGRGKKAKK